MAPPAEVATGFDEVPNERFHKSSKLAELAGLAAGVETAGVEPGRAAEAPKPDIEEGAIGGTPPNMGCDWA